MTVFKKNKILDNFKKLTPFYSRKLNGAGDFNHAPLTSKHELLSSQKKQPPFGNFTNKKVAINQIYRTSGTSSNPLLLTFSKKDIDFITDIGNECLRYAGMGKLGNNEIVINCLNLSMWVGGVLDSQSISKTGVQVINFGAGNTSELIRLIKELGLSKRNKISLHCTPSYLPHIASRLETEYGMLPQDLNVYSFYLGGESGIQNNYFRKTLIEKWSSKIINANYGLSEICSALASANDENILRFAPLFTQKYYIELRDSKGGIKHFESLKEGDEGEMIVTTPIKESQPLFRYNTREILRIVKKDHKNLFFEILGRTDDMLIYKGINVFPEQFRSIISKFNELTGLYQLQVCKQNDIIEKITLICEKQKGEKINEMELKNKLSVKIKSELSILPAIVFTKKITIAGNKIRLIEFV
ncbi:MAG TPA: hypothetical protein PLS26_11805 [Bacteroidales bacterium]|nr:hypothetical protein [Bacteroidales bacterium]